MILWKFGVHGGSGAVDWWHCITKPPTVQIKNALLTWTEMDQKARE